MKGRAPTATERKFHDMLCNVVGCAACRFGHNMVTHYVSVHHQRGRVRPLAHYFVLPLCAGHHQAGTGGSWMIAVHPDKAQFEQRYGEQEHLLRLCVLFLLASGQDVPELALTAAEVERDVADRVAALTDAGGARA